MKSITCRVESVVERMRVALATLLISLMAASSAQAANTTSFPQYPLLTGGSSIPPNVLMILDDSGSMAFLHMPTDKSSLADTVVDRSYVNNTLYYNPSAIYRPWRTSSATITARLDEASIKAVSRSATTLGDKGDLRGTSEFYFYTPKVSNPGTNAANYDKYRIVASTSDASDDGSIVQKLASAQATVQIANNISVTAGAADALSSNYRISPAAGADVLVAARVGNKSDAYQLEVIDAAGNIVCTGSSSGRDASCTFQANGGAYLVRLRVWGTGSNWSTHAISNGTISQSWEQWTAATPTGRSQKDELQNFANWYQYHRSRNKMAKAGASEAFGRLGKNYRVGLDTIWNRDASGKTIRASGSIPAYPIPVSSNDGLFVGANRDSFYSRLQGATASSGTPLHGALQRAGRYYSTDDAYLDSSGQKLSCRQNYAILTTDGYWNDKTGFDGAAIEKYSDGTPAGDGKGNVDGGAGYPYQDSIAYTLADVAYYYWRNDLSPMTNNVRTSGVDPANWQHMVTFGVSIGVQGNYNPNGQPPNPFPDVWLGDRYDNASWNNSDGAQRIDDLWHASINGHGSFVVASDTDKFASALTAALAAIDSRSASGSNIASSSTKTETTTLTFVAGFTSGSWIGDLIASPFNAALTGVSSTPKWSMSGTFKVGGVNAQATVPFASRTVLTSFGGTAQTFDSTSLAGATVFQRSGTTNDVGVADNINYLRGDQSKEVGRAGGTLRKRAYPLGDIVDSSPAYVEDTGTVYVGANDGMLHGIRVSDGKVLFSYVPKGLDFAELAKLSSTDYEHRYFVDGQIDVISRANQAEGKNILVGALGRGGRGVFALDVTAPDRMGASNVLWDRTTQDLITDKNMGYVLGSVRIRKGNGGKTYALVPNGIDSPNGTSTLFAYELDANGGIAATHELIADPGSGNGLMSLGLADLNGDGLVDVVYGGDLLGNVWRWDFSGNTPKAAVKLFQAVDAANKPQPITGGLAVGRNSTGKVFVGFGTGRFISNADVPGGGTSQTQSLYGIVDEAATIAGGRADLERRTIPYSGKTAKGEDARGFETYSVLPSDKKGWYIDLPVPERVISAPTVYGSGMYVASVVPATGSDCSGASGRGYINALNLFTGTAPKSGSYFTDTTALQDGKGGSGVIGSVGISGGMPTEVNVTSGLATVGTGTGPSELDSGTSSTGINPPTGSQPSRVSWREIVR